MSERAFGHEGTGIAPRVVPDIPLTDHAGNQVRMRDLAGKVLVVNFVTTYCSTVCIQVTRELQSLQKALGDRMDRDVVFLSIGLDPTRDTPAALQRFARRHGVDFNGWAFLSGTGDELGRARRAFGALAIQIPTSRGPDHYEIEHTSATYLVDREGVLRRKIQPGLMTLVGLTEIKSLLAPGS